MDSLEKYQLLRRTITEIDYQALYGVLQNSKCVPCDIDGVLERNNCFLFIECKQLGEEISLGQSLMYERLARLDPKRIQVLVVRLSGKKLPTGAFAFDPREYFVVGRDKDWQPIDLQSFIKRLKLWEIQSLDK